MVFCRSGVPVALVRSWRQGRVFYPFNVFSCCVAQHVVLRRWCLEVGIVRDSCDVTASVPRCSPSAALSRARWVVEYEYARDVI